METTIKTPCGLYQFTTETPTHWVGRTGNEYPKNDYANHGEGGIKHGKKDLPHDEYPYTIKYHVQQMFKVCETCTCEGKKLSNYGKS